MKFRLVMWAIVSIALITSVFAEDIRKVDGAVIEALESQKTAKVFVLTANDDTLTRESISQDATIGVTYTTFNGFEAEINSNSLDILSSDPNVIAIGEVKELSINLQDSVPLINADDVWSQQVDGLNITGEGETVCIIDTGVDYTHPELSSAVIIGTGYDYYNDDNDPMDDNNHGTHVAGIVHRVAPNARIIPFKVCSNKGAGCSSTSIAAAIDSCVANQTTYNISIISISLGDGGEYDDPDCFPTDIVAVAAKNAEANGIFIAVSSGNNGYTNGISYPACLGSVTSVGGTTKTNTLYTNGNTGPNLDILAPAVSINSTIIGGLYATKTGTSMAAPHVSGAAALLFQYSQLNGDRVTPKELENQLKNGGVAISNWKRIDVLSSLTADTTIYEGSGGGGGVGGGGGGGVGISFSRIAIETNNNWAIGQSTPITIRTYDNTGNAVDVPTIVFTISKNNMELYRTTILERKDTGKYSLSFVVPNNWELGEYNVKVVGTTATYFWGSEFGKSDEKIVKVVNAPNDLSITGEQQETTTPVIPISNDHKPVWFFVGLVGVCIAGLIIVVSSSRSVRRRGRKQK